MEFVDLVGASGTAYRFRLWTDRSRPPMAGNYVLMRPDPGGATLMVIGVTNDLSRLPDPSPVSADAEASQMFIRLNVARAIRISEHEDLAAAHGSVKLVGPEA